MPTINLLYIQKGFSSGVRVGRDVIVNDRIEKIDNKKSCYDGDQGIGGSSQPLENGRSWQGH